MNTGTTLKRIKRRFKKKLYNFLLVLNEVDFSKFRPAVYLLLIAAMLLALIRLPTTETTNTGSETTLCGAELAASIRTVFSAKNNAAVDVVALFLPENSSEDIAAALAEETLYSFYLSGKELSYLTEGAVTAVSGNNTLYLDGLNYTYHKNRLPFNRVTELSTPSGAEITDNMLYHVISTEDIFSLFHYISYRSLGIMSIYPKDATGALLSDYQKVVLTEAGTPFTIGTSLTAKTPVQTADSSYVSVVTMQRGFNLIDLVREPNKITICVAALFLAFVALLWYIVPRIRRIRLWFRIYRIRSRKRSTHTLYGLRKRF